MTQQGRPSATMATQQPPEGQGGAVLGVGGLVGGSSSPDPTPAGFQDSSWLSQHHFHHYRHHPHSGSHQRSTYCTRHPVLASSDSACSDPQGTLITITFNQLNQLLSPSERQQNQKPSSMSCSVWLSSLVEKEKGRESPLGNAFPPRFYQDSWIQVQGQLAPLH